MSIIHDPYSLLLSITAALILFLSGVIVKYFWWDNKFLTRKERREVSKLVDMF